MGSWSSAATELTRFWLQARHGCLIDESVAVIVPGGYSAIDFVAIRSDLSPFHLPDGSQIGPRLIVDTKDEHDYDPNGRDIGARLMHDIGLMGTLPSIPTGTKGAKFPMLREEHYQHIQRLFGSADFDRLFVVHALDPQVRAQFGPMLAKQGHIHWITIPEVLADVLSWYKLHPRPASLRQSLMGDVIHLLVGYCHFDLTLPAKMSQP